MERLTCKNEYYSNDFMEDGVYLLANKLRKLEDLEEQLGIPLELLSKIGTKVFIINFVGMIEEVILTGINYLDGKMWFQHKYNFLTKDIYLKREEAEKKLEELKNESQ